MPPNIEASKAENTERKLASDSKGRVLAAALTAFSSGAMAQEWIRGLEEPPQIVSENPHASPERTIESHGRLELSPTDSQSEGFELSSGYAQDLVRAKIQEPAQAAGVEYRGIQGFNFATAAHSLNSLSDVAGERVREAFDSKDDDPSGFEAARRFLPDTLREIRPHKSFDHPDLLDEQVHGWGDILVGEVVSKFPQAAGMVAASVARHAMRESILQQAVASRNGFSEVQFALDSRNPQNMLLNEEWRLAPGVTVKGGIDVSNYDLRFDPSVGLAISLDPSSIR